LPRFSIFSLRGNFLVVLKYLRFFFEELEEIGIPVLGLYLGEVVVVVGRNSRSAIGKLVIDIYHQITNMFYQSINRKTGD